MAKFVFQLETVLKHRRNVEKERQRAVAEVQAEMTAWERKLRELDESVKAATEDLKKNRLTGVLDMGYLAAHRRFTIGGQRRAIEIAQEMAKVQVRLDAARRELAEAAKQRKIIEKLREKQYERWREALGQKEQAAMDEVGMQLAFADLQSPADDADAAVVGASAGHGDGGEEGGTR